MIDTLIPAAGPYSWVSFDSANLGLNLAPGASASVTVKASAAVLAMGDHTALLAFGVGGAEVGRRRYCFPRHRMPSNSRNEGSKCRG